MAVIKLLTGTTADYQAVENVLILDEREIAVEITTDEDNPTIKYFNIRQGDGVHTFFDLPIIVNNERMEKLNTVMASYYDEVRQFSSSMTASAALANQAAEAATQAAAAANSAAQNVDNLTAGLNSMTDDLDGQVYTLGVEGGVMYLDDGVIETDGNEQS